MGEWDDEAVVDGGGSDARPARLYRMGLIMFMTAIAVIFVVALLVSLPD